jgi:hypothetical protein
VELDQLRQQARIRCATNSYAIGLLANLTNNTIGKGYSYTVTPIVDPGATEPRPERQNTVLLAQKVVDDFCRLNNWNGAIDPRGTLVISGSRERETYRRVKRDGEAFLRYFFQDNGSTVVRFTEPEQIRDPGGVNWADGWSWGIKHQMQPYEDVETPIEYAVVWQDPSAKGGKEPAGTVDYVPADEMLHLKGPDTDGQVKRGTSAFVYDTGRALDRAAKVQRNASMGAAVRAATAEIWQHATATQAGISSMVANLAEFSRSNAQTGKLEQYERIHPGSVRRIPAGQELVQPPGDQSESYLTAAQGDLRQAAAGQCAPEFWMAETSSGNYSNLESAAAPAVRMGQCEQEYFKAAFARAIWKAVEWAAKCALLPPDIADMVTIEVEAPAVLHRNELEKAQEDQIGVQVGWLDRQTACESRGLDWDTVQQRNDEFNDQQMQQQAAMQQMMGGPEGPEDEGPPKPGGAPFKESKDDSGHEHDQLGRFGVAGGGDQSEREKARAAFRKSSQATSTANAAKQAAEHELHKKLGDMSPADVRAIAAKHGIDHDSMASGSLHRAIAAHPEARKTVLAFHESKDASGHEHKGKGPGGGEFTGNGGGGATAGKHVSKLTKTDKPAFSGKPVETGKISKQEAGAIGEEIVIAHLKAQGFDDARHLNIDRNNFPIDLVQDHESIEVKTGQVSNGAGAQQWRLTIGEPGKEEKAWLAKASAEDKAAWNANKQQAITERKKKCLADLSKKLGKPVKAKTMTVLLDPARKVADIYMFEGWHDRIGWNSEAAKKAFVGSFSYG